MSYEDYRRKPLEKRKMSIKKTRFIGIISIIIIIITSFLIGVITSIFINIPIDNTPNNNAPKFYIAIDDINIGRKMDGSDPFSSDTKITYDSTIISFSYYGVGTANVQRYGFMIRFDLTTKPNIYEKCEISLYKKSTFNYPSSLYKVYADVYLFESDWTEEEWDGYGNYMSDFIIDWKIDEPIEKISNGGEQKFYKIDITDYLPEITTNTFSMLVCANYNYNPRNAGAYFYSSEWTGEDFPYVLPEPDSYKAYLPQLVWS